MVPAAKASDSDYIAAVTTYMEKCYATACPVSANASLIQRMKNGYVSAYNDLDAVMKELLSVAAKRNRRFILAITADHGELFGEHGGFAHSGGFVPELLSIPAVVFDSQRSYGGRTVCTPMLSSELLSRVAESATAGNVDGLLKEMERPVVRVQARDLGAAEIDTRAGALRFHIKESMRAQRGTWHNIHTTEQGTVPFPMAQCRPRTDRANAR